MKQQLIWTLSFAVLAAGCEGVVSAQLPNRSVDGGTTSPDTLQPPPSSDDGGVLLTSDGAAVVTPPVVAPPATTGDAGTPSTPTTPAADAGAPTTPTTPTTPTADCPDATRLWFDDFETGDNRNWTGRGYGEGWGNACDTTQVSTEMPRPGGGTYVQRSDNTCPSVEDVHRGYGGLQFSGDTVLPGHTNVGTGLSAPNGIVSTEWVWLDAGYTFGNGRWVNIFSVFPDCGYNNSMITLGIDNPDGILRPAHHWPQGVLTIAPGAPAFPMGRWVRVTIHIDFAHGRMVVWQDGQKVLQVENITRSITSMCQFHWGLYSSGDNTDILMYEDDKSIWRLDAPLANFEDEPWLDDACAP